MQGFEKGGVCLQDMFKIADFGLGLTFKSVRCWGGGGAEESALAPPPPLNRPMVIYIGHNE